jgi:broad specificity phosphatase PhoE
MGAILLLRMSSVRLLLSVLLSTSAVPSHSPRRLLSSGLRQISLRAGLMSNAALRYLAARAGTGETGKGSMPTVFFITHPDVAIDPGVSVPDWPLSERGRARMRAMTTFPRTRRVRHIFASSERKARDAAQILADGLGLAEYTVVDDLGETDRSATGYLPKEEFEATADAFFARPKESVRGWEPAADAPARIVGAVNRIVSQAPADEDVAILGHGGTGTFLYCHLAGLPTDRRHDQPATNGGN